VDTINYILLSLYAAGAWYFGAPKYPKRLSIQQGGFSLPHAHQKSSGTLFCVQFLYGFELSFMNTKPLRFRFGGAVCSALHLFF